jgi:hypothetical protein
MIESTIASWHGPESGAAGLPAALPRLASR